MRVGSAISMVVVASIALGACSSAGSSQKSESDSATGSSTQTAASAATASPATGQPASAAESTAGVPLTIAKGSTGRSVPLVSVSVGGGPPVKVTLDTGSTGLVLLSSRVGSQAHATGQRFTRQYSGFSLKGEDETAPVSIVGSGTRYRTSGPIHVGAITSGLTDFLTSVGAVGIMGVAAGQSSTEPPLLSPLASLPPPLAQGYVVDLHDRRVVLGPPSLPDAERIPLVKAGWSYPNGLPGYQKPVRLTWTLGTRRAALPTVFDTGGGDGFYNRSFVPQQLVVGTGLRPGTAVALASGSHTLLRFTAGQGSAPDPAVTNGSPVMNAGLALFRSARVGLDLLHGQLLVAPGA